MGIGAGLLDDRADLFDKILLTHLQGADIDRDGQAFGCWIGRPASQLTAGDFQHQGAEREDETGAFRHRDEFARRNHAFLRMRPARQRFCPQQLSFVIYLRLVMQ